MLPRVHRKRIDLTVLSSGPGLLAGTPAVHVNRLAPGDEVRLTGSPEAGAVCSTTITYERQKRNQPTAPTDRAIPGNQGNQPIRGAATTRS